MILHVRTDDKDSLWNKALCGVRLAAPTKIQAVHYQVLRNQSLDEYIEDLIGFPAIADVTPCAGCLDEFSRVAIHNLDDISL
jgi:hypothetical protein